MWWKRWYFWWIVARKVPHMFRNKKNLLRYVCQERRYSRWDRNLLEARQGDHCRHACRMLSHSRDDQQRKWCAFFAQILNIWIQELICNAKICMIKKKEKGFVTLCRYKWVRPAHKHQLPHMSETWCGMKTQITFYTSLLGKCPISSEMWKNSEDFYSRRGAIRSATHASFTNVRCPLPESVLFVIGKRATSNNVFHALFLLKS